MFTLTVWTNENEPHQFTAETRGLVLRALRHWMNGNYGGVSLTVRDCTGTDDVTLGWDGDRWRVRWGTFVDGGFAEWDGATGAAEAFVGACACKVADLTARCRCADCRREMVRAHAPWVPGRGWVCFDCLVYYLGRPDGLSDPIVEGGI